MIDAGKRWLADLLGQGVRTIVPKALDGDVILAAQALTMSIPADEVVVATTDVRHLSRFVTAERWQDIR